MAGGICESPNIIMDQATNAPMWQPQTNVTDESLAASDEAITDFTPSIAFIAARQYQT